MSSLPSSLDHTQAHQHDEAFQRSMAASPEPKSTAPNQFSRKSMMRNDPNYSNDSNNDRVGSSRESVRKLISRTVPASTDDNSYGNPKDTRQNECTHNDDDTAGDQTAQSVFEYQQSSSHSLVSIANTTPINTTATATIYRPPVRPMVELCEHLLNEIGKSIKVFKPSKSLSMLNSLSSESLREPRHQAEIDIVISGGGMKCYFMTGCHSILVQELNRRGVKIARVAGASAGAWSGMFMCTEMGTQTWLESYYGFRERQGCTMHEAYDDMVSKSVREREGEGEREEGRKAPVHLLCHIIVLNSSVCFCFSNASPFVIL